MIALDDTSNPVSIRYNLATSWGVSSQEITLDVPALFGLGPETALFALRLWQRSIQTCITHNCQLSFTEIVNWKSSPLPFLGATGAPSGLVPGPSAPRNGSGVIVMHNGMADKWSRRHMFVPDMPLAWQNNRVLTDAGQIGIYGLAAKLFMGCNQPELDGEMTWLMAFNGVVDRTPANVSGVAFRRVQWLRVCSYTDDAPDEVPLDWP